MVSDLLPAFMIVFSYQFIHVHFKWQRPEKIDRRAFIWSLYKGTMHTPRCLKESVTHILWIAWHVYVINCLFWVTTPFQSRCLWKTIRINPASVNRPVRRRSWSCYPQNEGRGQVMIMKETKIPQLKKMWLITCPETKFRMTSCFSLTFFLRNPLPRREIQGDF